MHNMRLAVLISGGGTTLLNFFEKKSEGKLSADIVCVISSLERCAKNEKVLKKCADEKVPVKFIRPKDFKSKEAFWQKQNEVLDSFQPDLIALAGYLKFWHIPERYLGKVLNIHPALLPKFGGKSFYGLRVHEAVLKSDEKISGCTVHFANNQYDSGPIILQKKVPVLPDDTPKTLQRRVFEQECEAYPEAINLFAKDKIVLEADKELTSGKVIIKE